jgi:hypothetical protein
MQFGEGLAEMFILPTTSLYINQAAFDMVSGDGSASQQRRAIGDDFWAALGTSEYQLAPNDSRFVEHFLKLKSLAKSCDLNNEEVEPPSKEAIARCDLVLKAFEKEGLVPSRVVASAEGGVGVCFVAGNNYADIECLNTGEILGVVTNRNDRPVVWDVGQGSDSIERACSKIAQFFQHEAPQKNVARQQKSGRWF